MHTSLFGVGENPTEQVCGIWSLRIPYNPRFGGPLNACKLSTYHCLDPWLVDFIVFFCCGTHNSWSSCMYTFYVFWCCWSWQYLHRPQNLQTSTFQCISLFKFIYFIVVGVGVLPSGSPRVIPRRVVMSRNSLRSERDGARNTKI